MENRLQKLLSAAGVCSRRRAEEYILAGRVAVNGRTARLGDKADPARDRIEVDGTPLSAPAGHTYIMLNKPRGYVTTLSDEKGRKTVADLAAACPARVWPVGRLHMDSEGLLLLT
ncbi:MAG: pseudouridine synthase, partial [Oscillospiraceae bacterium]|nr:pseudouridine synthase [Oscillospiraceae bacterium]